MSTLMGIDIGTTSIKIILLDPIKGIITEESLPNNLETPFEGWAEENPNDWWESLCKITKKITISEKISGLAVSGMVPCAIFLDENGNVLRNSIQQNDIRAEKEIHEFREVFKDSNVLERTGSQITQQSIGPKILWLQRNEPETWRMTRKICGSYDFITYKLSGNLFVESNWALESGIFDLEQNTWGPDILSFLNISNEYLPEIKNPSELAGYISKEVSKKTGLPEGLPVFIGSADHVASAFSSGVLNDGDLLIKLGGAADILTVSDKKRIDERLYLDYHLVPNKFLPNGCMATSGSLIKWFQTEIANGTSLKNLDKEAASIAPGSDGIVALPYFLGEKTPLNDPSARGAFIGLHLGHKKAHFFRAILESIAFGIKHHLDVFQEIGYEFTRVRISNGGSKSGLWTQMISDIIGYPIEKIKSHGGSSLGAAFVAGMGNKSFTKWGDIDRFLSIIDTTIPHFDTRYEKSYRVFRDLYPSLKKLYQKN